MIVYKFRHKPTGLFYKAVKGNYGSRTNLSKEGSVYQNKFDPTKTNRDEFMIQVTAKQLIDFALAKYEGRMITMQKVAITKPEDWERVEYELKEIIK